MACRLFWLMACCATLLSVSLARHEDCENPPAVTNAAIEIQDDEDTVRALYTCHAGYELHGASELNCNLDDDLWDIEPPTCVKVGTNDVEEQRQQSPPRKKPGRDVLEDRNVPEELATSLDMTCAAAKVAAPDISHGYVQKYEKRRKGPYVFLVVFYGCNNNYELEDTNTLYCSGQKWVGEQPVCVRVGEYTDEDEAEYGEYEVIDEDDDVDEEGEEEEEEDDVNGEEDDERVNGQNGNEIETNYVSAAATPPPPPPPAPVNRRDDEEEEVEEEEEEGDVNNEIPSVNTPPQQPSVSSPAPETEITSAVTDVNIIVEPTQDPYTPRLLDENCGTDRGGCEHKCERLLFPGENEPRLKCSCFDGFTLDPNDYASCHDNDECQVNNGGCEQICNNLPGSFQCSCEHGLQIDTLTGNTCIDINECLLRNGHGPCQDTCHNLKPGYNCSCDGLPGTRLAVDGHACEDAGACQLNNGNCSHICVSSVGRVYCLCPAGMQLAADDNKRCADINECELAEVVEQCGGVCENTHGSYHCSVTLNERTIDDEHDEEETNVGNEGEEEAEEEEEGEEQNGDGERVNESEGDELHCSEGYRLNSGRCVDVDECAEGTSGCEYCVNSEGSYECSCPAGFDLGADERTCHDINECQIVYEADDENAAPYKACSDGCVNTIGSFYCTCDDTRQHLIADGSTCALDTCRDLDDPRLNKTRCAFQCVDLPSGVYECICPSGYRLATDLHSCDVAENICSTAGGYERCAPGRCEASADNEERYTCHCPTGFQHSNDAKQPTCHDIDECATGAHECSHQCMNTVGAYQCLCPPGYRFEEGTITNCVDIDECAADTNLCGGLRCENTAGAYSCHCADGNQPDATNGQCAVADPCAGHRCSHKCVVVNDGASFECICPEDMVLLDGLSCGYRDYCADANNGCEHICQLEAEGACACRAGYLLAANGKSCDDVNECEVRNGGCHQRCHNLPGAYRCECLPGFEPLDGPLADYCFDVDECARGTHSCNAAAGLVCENLNGSYTCLCPPGFALGTPPPSSLYSSTSSPFESSVSLSTSSSSSSMLSPYSYSLIGVAASAAAVAIAACLDIDECSIANGNCSHFCLNFAGSHQCACPPGFVLDAASGNHTCHDVDECAADDKLCSSVCINLLGSFECACEPGFQLAGDRRTCIDADECALGTHDCSHECVNVDGGYECLCPSGYQLTADRRTCADIDECAGHEHGCSHQCVNRVGAYECLCPADRVLALDGKTCDATDPCPAGTVPGVNGISCVRPHECLYDNGGCSHICTPSLGCSCPSDLVLGGDGKRCVLPVTCPTGFMPDPSDPKRCVDIDECAATPGACQYKCRNTNGGYECICPSGYTLRGSRNCEDIDECRQNNGGCVGGECINQNGSFECRCPRGQRLATDRRTCVAMPITSHVSAPVPTSLTPMSPRVQSLATPSVAALPQGPRDHCQPFVAPLNGDMHCTKYRHKRKHFYNTRCKVWCNEGYRLSGPAIRFCNATGLWDDHVNECTPIICPPLPPARNGVIAPSSCMAGSAMMGQHCRLQCQPGYMPVGKSVAVCTAHQVWSVNSTLDCDVANSIFASPAPHHRASLGGSPVLRLPLPSYPHHQQHPVRHYNQHQNHHIVTDSGNAGHLRPYIKCPRNTTLYLGPNELTAYVELQRPLTNLDQRHIDSQPEWVKQLKAHLPVGTHVLSFRGHDPASRKRVRCQTVIDVRRANAPQVLYCTPSFDVVLGPGQALRSVVWEEPRFHSPGGLKKLFRSRMPGELFGVGLHSIYYQATNQEGVSSQCEFKINVKPVMRHLSQPQPNPLSVLPPLNIGPSSVSIPEPAPANIYHPTSTGIVAGSGSIGTGSVSGRGGAGIKLLPGHESYIVCPDQAPVKVTQTQTVNLQNGCVLKNVRVQPMRQYAQRRQLVSQRWTPFSAF